MNTDPLFSSPTCEPGFGVYIIKPRNLCNCFKFFLVLCFLLALIVNALTLSQNSPGFYVSGIKIFSKKEKLLVTSKVSYSHSVFYSSGKVSATFIKFAIVVCKLFHFGRV